MPKSRNTKVGGTRLAPRLLFAADGSMHHCLSKSDLMTVILEKVKASKEFVYTTNEENSAVIVDAMAEVLKRVTKW